MRPCSAKAHYYLGEIAARAGDAAGAESRYRRAIECDPRYAAGQVGLGALLVRSGRYEAALEALRRAVELEPASADAQYNLAQALLRLGRREEAQAALARVDEIHAAKHATAQQALSGSGEDRKLEGLASPDFARSVGGGRSPMRVWLFRSACGGVWFYTGI